LQRNTNSLYYNYNPRNKLNSNVGVRCIVPSGKLGNNMKRAQFIVPLHLIITNKLKYETLFTEVEDGQ